MQYKIVASDDDLETLELIKAVMELDNYDVTAVSDGKVALAKVREIKPDIVLLDYDMPGMNGHDVCAELKKDHSTQYIPVIILSGTRVKIYDKILGLQAGADDYMVKPFDPNELRARVARAIQRTREIISLNPLTKLPGSTRIEEEISARLSRGAKFAVGYLDLDHFKAYNDVYGYIRGDNVIHLLHQVIFESISMHGNKEDFIGHIGGDDFILVTTLDKVDAVCSHATRDFDSRIPAYYNQEDRDSGFIVTTDRRGNKRNFPIMTVSIGVSTNENRHIAHYGEFIDVLIEMKKYAKSIEQKKGSVFVKDKRTSETKTF